MVLKASPITPAPNPRPPNIDLTAPSSPTHLRNPSMDLTIPGTIPSEKLAVSALPASLKTLPAPPKLILPKLIFEILELNHSNALPTLSTTGLRKDNENLTLSNLSAYSPRVGQCLRTTSPKTLNENVVFSNHFESPWVPLLIAPKGLDAKAAKPFLIPDISGIENLKFLNMSRTPGGIKYSHLTASRNCFQVVI